LHLWKMCETEAEERKRLTVMNRGFSASSDNACTATQKGTKFETTTNESGNYTVTHLIRYR